MNAIFFFFFVMDSFITCVVNKNRKGWTPVVQMAPHNPDSGDFAFDCSFLSIEFEAPELELSIMLEQFRIYSFVIKKVIAYFKLNLF
jgi:hypothetical protein